MLDKKIHYRCQNCSKEYWVSPLSGGDQDVVVQHPCSNSNCGAGIELCFKGVAELSLMGKENESM